MAANDIYFSGQGEVYLGDRNPSTGLVVKFRYLGNVSALRLALTTDILEHKESHTGGRLIDLRLIREKTATVTATLENFSKENLQLLLYGTVTTAGASTATNEAFTNPVAVGDTIALVNEGVVSSVVVKDNTNANLTEGTHYTVNYGSGLITILNLGAFAQPLKANYSYAATTSIQLFKDTYKERYLKFAALNTGNALKPSTIDLYRVTFDPVSNLDLITDDVAQFELTGSALYDATRDLDSTLGGFGRVVQDFT